MPYAIVSAVVICLVAFPLGSPTKIFEHNQSHIRPYQISFCVLINININSKLRGVSQLNIRDQYCCSRSNTWYTTNHQIIAVRRQ